MTFTEKKRIRSTRFADVYTAHCSERNTTVALKVTSPDDERPPHCSRDEIRLLEQLAHSQHRNVAVLLTTFTQDVTDTVLVFPCYAFTLVEWLKHHATKLRARSRYLIDTTTTARTTTEYTSTLSASAALEVVKGLASGLCYLHAHQVIHRDIKPENIMFQGYNAVPIIIDFGISYQYPDNFGKEPASRKICDVSTGVYKAPELLFGIADYSYGVDIWALGIVMTMIYSKNVKPIFDDEDIVDFRLMGMIFSAFGVPSLETWPEASKSSSFANLQLTASPPAKPLEELLPSADDSVRAAFHKMMVYDSSKRLTSAQLCELLG